MRLRAKGARKSGGSARDPERPPSEAPRRTPKRTPKDSEAGHRRTSQEPRAKGPRVCGAKSGGSQVIAFGGILAE